MKNHERFRALADSINSTALMARTTLGLVLLVGVYLIITLLSSSDSAFIRNSTVTLPQLNIGLSIETSYALAPPVFLYLHFQLLFFLHVLKKKMDQFETLIEDTFSLTDTHLRSEVRSYLSAFSFVQLFQSENTIKYAAMFLTFVGVNIFPLLILFALDISFLRYQSSLITFSHHVWFLFDIALLWHFNRIIFFPRNTGTKQSHTLPSSTPAIRRRLISSFLHVTRLFAAITSIAMVGFLLVYAWPPAIFGEMHKSERDLILGKLGEPSLRAILGGKNVFDAYLCPRWRVGCRRLVADGQVFSSDVSGRNFEQDIRDSDEAYIDYYQKIHGIDLTERSLRYADFSLTWLIGARFQGS